jgi:hypothetical protein
MENIVYGFIVVMGVIFVAVSVLLGRLHVQRDVDPAQQVGQRYALEFSVAAVFFAVMGLISYLLWGDDGIGGAILRLESLLLGGFIALQMVRAINNTRRFGARSRIMLVLMLAISAFFLTIEVVNAVWWSETPFYLYGIMWILTLGALQLAAVMVDAHAETPQAFRSRGAFLRRFTRQRVRGERAASDSDSTPKPHANIDNHRLPYH